MTTAWAGQAARLRYIHEAAEAVRMVLAAAQLPAQLASVTQPGYPVLTAPFVAVDAPSIEEWAGYLGEAQAGAEPYAIVSVPVRVVPADSADGAGLVALTDAVLTALADGSQPGLVVTSVTPTTSVGQGTAAQMPAYLVNVQLSVIP